MDATAIVAILAGIGAMLGGFYKVISEVNDREKKDYKRSNEYVNKRIDELRKELVSVRKEMDIVRHERDVAQAEVVKLRSEVKSLKARLDKYETTN